MVYRKKKPFSTFCIHVYPVKIKKYVINFLIYISCQIHIPELALPNVHFQTFILYSQ